MRKILKDQSGVALITVLAIMLVISILATGLFYFTYNEANFAEIEYDSTEATYLARAGIEIASKSFNGVSGNFNMSNTDSQPIVTTLYLHRDDSTGEATISAIETNNSGKVTVKISQEKRPKDDPDGHNVLAYKAIAEIGKSKSIVTGITLLNAFGNGEPTVNIVSEPRHYLNWVPENGVVNKNLKDSTNAFVYKDSGSVSAAGPIENLINNIFGIFGAELNIGEVPVYAAEYPGVVTIANDVFAADYMSVDTSLGNGIYAMAAPAIIVDVPVNMQKKNATINAFSFVSNTIVFNKEITIYANDFETSLGDIIIAPMADTGIVYFNEPVFVVSGNKTFKLFEKGTVFSFTEPVQLFTYAVEHGFITTGLSGWLRTVFSGENAETGELEGVENPPIEEPNANSLTEIIWE